MKSIPIAITLILWVSTVLSAPLSNADADNRGHVGHGSFDTSDSRLQPEGFLARLYQKIAKKIEETRILDDLEGFSDSTNLEATEENSEKFTEVPAGGVQTEKTVISEEIEGSGEVEESKETEGGTEETVESKETEKSKEIEGSKETEEGTEETVESKETEKSKEIEGSGETVTSKETEEGTEETVESKEIEEGTEETVESNETDETVKTADAKDDDKFPTDGVSEVEEGRHTAVETVRTPCILRVAGESIAGETVRNSPETGESSKEIHLEVANKNVAETKRNKERSFEETSVKPKEPEKTSKGASEDSIKQAVEVETVETTEQDEKPGNPPVTQAPAGSGRFWIIDKILSFFKSVGRRIADFFG